METALDNPTLEINRLRGCVTDLVRVLALPAAWAGGDPPRIAGTLIDALLGMLRADFVYARLSGPGDAGEMVSLAPATAQWTAREVGAALDQSPGESRIRIGDADLSIASSGLGLQGELGAVVAGSRRPDFPSETEKLLLDVAASQATIALQEVRRVAEASRAALPESEADARKLVGRIPGIVLFFMRPDGELEVVSPQLTRYFGKTLEELKHWMSGETVHPDDRPQVIEVFRRAIAAGEPYKFEARFRRADGVYQWFQCRGLPRRDESGRIIRWSCVGIDIDERKRAETLLAGERQLLEMVASGRSIPDTLEALCRLVEEIAGGSYCSLVLVDPSGTKFSQAIAPSVAREFSDAVRGWPLDRRGGPCVMAARERTQVIVSDVTSDTRWRDSWRALAQAHGLRSCWSTPVVSQAGKVLGTFALYRGEPGSPSDLQLDLIRQFTNIASIAIERAQGDEALRRSEARLAAAERDLKQMIDSIPVYVSAYEPDGTRSFVNRTWQEYMGLTLEQATAADPRSFPHFHPDDAERNEQAWRESLASGEPLAIEVRVRRADGQYRWHISRRTPLRDEHGRITKWYSIGIDIDDQKRAEEALRQSEARLADAERDLQLTIDTIPTLVTAYRPDGSRIFVNRSWLDYSGLSPAEAMAPARWSMVHPDDLARADRELSTSLANEADFKTELRLRRADGEYRWHAIHRVLARDPAGRAAKWYSTAVDIEDQKAAQEALRRSEAQLKDAQNELQLTIDTIPALVATYGPDGTRLFVNQTWRDSTGLTPQVATGEEKAAFPYFHHDDAGRVQDAIRASLASGEPLTFEVRLRRADGTYRWHIARRVPLRDANGSIIRWYSTGLDIEDQKVAQDALRESEARLAEAERELRLTLDSIPAITWRGAANGYVQRLNKRWLDYTGTTVEQVRGAGWKTCVHPDDLDQLVDIGRQYVTAEVPIDGEARLRRHDGVYRWFLFRPAPARDEAGRIIAWYGTITDIEDRKRAEEALRQSEARLAAAERELQLTIDTIPTLVATYRPDGSRIFVNRTWREYTGESSQSAMVVEGASFVHPDDTERVEQEWRDALASGVSLQTEVRLRRADGAYRWHAVHRVLARDEMGEIIKWYSVAVDIEDRKRAEEKLARAERELRFTLDSIPTMTWRGAPNSYVEQINKRFFDYTGTTPEAMQGGRWQSCVHPDDLPTLLEVARSHLSAGVAVDAEARLRRHDGEYRWFLFRPAAARDETGKIIAWYGIITDIEDRKRAEEALDKVRSELAHVTRVMSLGALTASIAHEVNQPLAGIITNASTCLRMLAADPPNVEGARETARRTIRDGNRAADVITRLRALFGKKVAATEAVDLSEAAREVLALVSSDLLRSRITLRAELGSESLLVTGDRVQLQQVILNLVRNAADAMSGISDRPRHLLITTSDDDGMATLVVRDVGIGFDAQAAGRLFDAFYTTKSDGMGIGLSVSRSIIESHGGRMWAEPNDGPGATFSFSLPRQAPSAGDEGTHGAIPTRPMRGVHDAARNA
jgi:PAS domain S-box-containing protein